MCSRSIASVQICTAVWKPNVISVREMSLSIVLGTPTTGKPFSCRRLTTFIEPSPPTADDRVEPVPVVGLADLLEAVLVGERLVAARAEDRPAERQDAAAAVDVEQLVVVVHHAPPRVAEADDRAVVGDLGGADRAADDGVEAGTVPASGEDADAHEQ